ncbi:MAG: ChuX/HutX family heme-like substrate-binding protein [Bacteroidota bacterium]
MEMTQPSLKDRWEALKSEQPKLRIRNAADQLGVSEVELLATQCGGDVTRLRPAFTEILTRVQELDKVMALTRNEEVVHERKGVYLNPSLSNPHVGLFVGEDIDLRIFFKPWASAYAVKSKMGDKHRYSLQFFAKDGQAIHKIFLTPHSDPFAYQKLVEDFESNDQTPIQEVTPWPSDDPEQPDEAIEVESFREGWINLKDTHDFFGLVRKHKLSRIQALRLAPKGNYAVKVDNDALRRIITLASERQVPIMVFVGNKGMIQIHTGPVKKLMDYENWFNVLDPNFNLHVNETKIAQSWVVRKPTTDGVVTALECFNEEGKQIVQLFGKRKPGIPELTEWQDIVASVEG